MTTPEQSADDTRDRASTVPVGADAPDGAAAPGRWRLHRGGVVNIWQYTDEEFDLSGGRVIFKGTNGSGKSRTLELLLPLCLDGDLRAMGCKGFDTVSMSRLMLDDYTEGTMRLGYAWIELRRVLADGTEDFCTCGVGVKASASGRQISDSWRFITPLRVNKDFPLVEQDRPITAARLREHLGEDAVPATADAFQQRVAATVYGISGGGRYPDLLHLQRTLRNPDIGLKVLQGQLEQLLSDALPPVDSEVIARTAAGLDNLEGVRRNVAGLRRADQALQEFLQSYRGYARGVLADRTARLDKAEKSAARAGTALERRRAEQAEAEEAHRAAAAERDRTADRREALQGELEALKASPAYGALGDLEDRESAVGAEQMRAEAALRTAADQRTAEEHGIGAVERAAALPARLGTAAADGAAALHAPLTAVGLPAALAPLSGLAPRSARTEQSGHALQSAEPGAQPAEVLRPVAPDVDTAALSASAATAAERVAAAEAAADDRARLLSGLRAEAERLDTEEAAVERAAERAETAAETSAQAAAAARTAEEQLTGTAQQWTDAVHRWRTTALPADAAEEDAGDGAADSARAALPEVPDPDDVVLDPGSYRDAARTAAAALQPRVRAAQRAAAAAEQRLSEVGTDRERLEAELAELHAAAGVEPAAPPFTTAERDPERGAPFYRLVDFAPDLADADRAGLEAALRASGLLTAWVPADGAQAGGDETWAQALEPAAGPSLADVLVPDTGSDGAPPVASGAVEALLRSVPLGTAPGGGLAVAADGRWSAGALQGRHSSAEAEHIGAGARERARLRRIDDAERALAETAEREEALRAEVAAARQRERAWAACLEAFPDIAPVLADHAETLRRRSEAARAAADAESADAEHARARARWEAARAEHRRGCGDLGVDAGAAALRELADRARSAAAELERLGTLLHTDYPEALAALDAALADAARTTAAREQAEEEARRAHRAFSEAHGVLETLRSSLGADAEEVGAQVRALTAERTELAAAAPKAQTEVEDRLTDKVRAEERTAKAESAVADAGGLLAEAEDALTDAAEVPGVWEAATGLLEVPFERDELRSALAEALAEEAAAGSAAALERDLIARIQTLQTALAGTHDVQMDRTEGTDVLTVAVSDETGTAPVASTARLTAARLEAAEQNLTDGEERVFEEFLLGDVAEELHRQIRAAESLTRRMNDVLEGAHSSQGVRVELSWEPAPHLDPAERSAFGLAKKSVAQRTPDENDRLRRALMDRIRATRAEGRSSGYTEVLGEALDYRDWFAYRVRIHDTGPDGAPRDRRVRQLSSGETRLVSYVTLFAASAAFYDALGSDLEGPLRLVLLDEAFERLDDPTIARLLELLVDLDMDWAITWPSGFGVSPKIDRMHIYDILKRKGAWGVACARTTWTGTGFERAA